MEYYYTRKQTFIQSSIKKAIILGMILLAVIISYSARASVAGCGLSASISSANVSCNGGNDGSATVIVSGGTAPYSYLWSSSPVQTTSAAIGLPAGTYTVTVTDTLGCMATATVVITEPAAPLSVTATGTDPTCAGDDGTALANASGGTGPYSYSWNTNPVQASAMAAGLAGGSYTVTVTDANNCIASGYVTLNNVTPVTATITGPDTLCQDHDYPFTITLHASGGTSYSWSNGSTSSAALVTPMITTTYSVVVSNGTCSDTAYHTITVFTIPHAWISGPSSVCPGDTVMLTAHGGASFMWDTGDTSQVLNAVPLVNTTYTVTVTNGICIDTVSHAVAVNSPVTQITGCSSPCASTSMKYKIDVNRATSYSWTVPAGWTIVAGQNTKEITVNTGDASSDGTIAVSTAGGECSTYNLQLNVDVMECGERLSIPNAFTPNSDGHNDTWEILNLKDYPGSEVSVINRWGNEVFHTASYDNSWNGNGLEEGTYFYIVKLQAADHDETGCATGSMTELVRKGYVMIIREK